MMKKIALCICLLCVLFSFIGCDRRTETTAKVTEATTTSSTPSATTTDPLRDDETANIILDFDLSSVSYLAPASAITLHSVLSNHAVLQ